MKRINQLALLIIFLSFFACGTGNNDKANLTPEQEIQLVDSAANETNNRVEKLEKDVDDLQNEVDELLNEINK